MLVPLPAGQVTPSPRPYGDTGTQLKEVSEEAWTPAMRSVVAYLRTMAIELLGCSIRVCIVNDIAWPFAATYGSRSLTLNLGRIGHKWFDGSLLRINDLMLHEYGHHFSGNHLSSEYHDALTLLGARLAQIALDKPELFVDRLGATKATA